VEPVIDRDTAGVPGSPDIAHTIFDKIDAAAVFVCDVSIVNADTAGRPTPNPNVLLRAILLDTTGQRTDTAGQPASAGEQARAAIEAGRPTQAARVRSYMRWLADEINRIAPDLSRTDRGDLDELLVTAVGTTEGLLLEFACLAEAVALMEAKEATEIIYKGFGPILEGYDLPVVFSGSFLQCQFDFHKFLGHELFVMFIGKLLKEGRWHTIADLLSDGIYVANGNRGAGTGRLVPFTYASEYVALLDYRSQRLKLNRVSMHADLLNERHTKGELGRAAPMQEFVDADCFLSLRAAFANSSNHDWLVWRPWSSLYMNSVPRFLLEAQSSRQARQLLQPLGIDSIQTFHARFKERAHQLAQLFHGRSHRFYPFYGFNPDAIGSDKFGNAS
jgi:hypothetical protein